MEVKNSEWTAFAEVIASVRKKIANDTKGEFYEESGCKGCRKRVP